MDCGRTASEKALLKNRRRQRPIHNPNEHGKPLLASKTIWKLEFNCTIRLGQKKQVSKPGAGSEYYETQECLGLATRTLLMLRIRFSWTLVITALTALACPLADEEAAGATTQPGTDEALAKLLVGAWKFAWPNGGSDTRIDLGEDGSYEWWAPYLQSDLAAKTMIQSGIWVVHDRTLSLRIDKVFLGHIAPGTTFTYDVVSVSSRKAVLNSPAEKGKIEWKRVSLQDEPFWQRAVSHKPPFKMNSHLELDGPGGSVGDWELYSGPEGGTNAGAKVVFHLGSIEESVAPERPAKPPETAAGLKEFIDSNLRTSGVGSNCLTSVIKIAGEGAVACMPLTSQVADGFPKCALPLVSSGTALRGGRRMRSA